MKKHRRAGLVAGFLILGAVICCTYYFYFLTPIHRAFEIPQNLQAPSITSNKTAVKTAPPSFKPAQTAENEKSKEETLLTAKEKFNTAILSKQSGSGATPIWPRPDELRPETILRNTPWELWLHTRVQNINDPNHSTNGTEALRLNNFIIRYDKNSSSSLRTFNKNKPLAVFDRRRNQVGILTGTIQVTTNRRDLLETDLGNIEAEISDAFDSIQTYFVVSRADIFDLGGLFHYLRQQSYIDQVELEILSRTYEKK